MAALHFEANIGSSFKVNGSYAILTESPDLGGTFPADGPFDPSQSNRLIQTDQPINVHLRWTVTGGLGLLISGKWDYRIMFEQMGGGEVNNEYKGSTNFVASTNHTYNVKVTAPANQLPAGTYRVIAVVNLVGPAPANAKAPVVAFSDLGLIEVFEAA